MIQLNDWQTAIFIVVYFGVAVGIVLFFADKPKHPRPGE